MRYANLKEVPANISSHKGVPLSLAQVNEWAAINDKLNIAESVVPASVAWTTWEKFYEAKNGQWVKRERNAAEGVDLETFVGAVRVEASDEDGLPSEAIVEIIKAGPTLTKKRFYNPEALKALAESKLLDGLKMYDAHVPNAEKDRTALLKPRSLTEYWSYIKEARWDEARQAIVARVKLCDRAIKEKLRDAWETIGVSLTGLVESVIGPDKLEHITRIPVVISADWVPEPNTGSKVIQIVEAADPAALPLMQPKPAGKEEHQMDWQSMTLEMLKANRPDLVDQIMSDSKRQEEAAKELVKKAEESAAAKAKEATDANAKAESAEKALATVKAEAYEANKKAEEQGKTIAEQAAKIAGMEAKAKLQAVVEEKAAALTPLAKSEVLKALAGQEFADEKAMAEAVDLQVKAALQKGGKTEGKDKPGDQPAVKPMAEASEKFAREKMHLTDEQIKRLGEIE